MPATFGYIGLWLSKFKISSCHERATLVNTPAATDLWLLAPPNMYLNGMSFSNSSASSMILPIGSASPNDTDVGQVIDQLTDIKVLGSTPGNGDTRLIYPHQYSQFSSQDVFFEQDGNRTFFITPKVTRRIRLWTNPVSTIVGNLMAPVGFYAASGIPAVNTPPPSAFARGGRSAAADRSRRAV